VIEAGPDGRNVPGIVIPQKKGTTLGSIYDWNITTIPQPGINNRVVTMNRGRVLGGSSALNLLSYDMGTTPDFDAWEEFGNPGWNSQSMFAAMRKSENYQRTSVLGSNQVDATVTGGPIDALINRFSPAQQEAFFPAMKNLGIGMTEEYLNGALIGVMRHTSAIVGTNYTRAYSPAYLALAKSNLHLMLNTTVAKINLDTKNSRAVGVMLSTGKKITAKKEVILSAGSVLSPQLLELSGIGGEKVLTAAGVKQLVDLPGVGENLQDHIRIVVTYELRKNYTSVDILRLNQTYATEQFTRYNNNQSSFYDTASVGYSYLNWSQVIGDDSTLVRYAEQSATKDKPSQKKLQFIKDKKYKPKVPQLEIIFSDGYLGLKGFPAVGSPLYGTQFFGLIAAIQHPLSHGSTHINSSNVSAKPIFNPNYLSNKYDLEAIKTASKYMRKIANTAPLKYAWSNEYEPGPAVQTDAQWESFAKNSTLTIWHPVGTCAMLPKEDNGVVDPKLRVYGVKGLRVVDASVMPALVSGHIQTAVYGIAERAAEMIAKDNR
jgi:choline dehydrogenase-like flavoprotein